MAFFNKQFQTPTVPQPLIKKVILEKKDVVLNYVHSKRFKNSYKFTFLITVLPIIRNFDNPASRIKSSDLDMISFRKAVIENLKPYDREYFDIYYLDTVKVEFVLKEKWFIEATRNLKVVKKINKFSQVFSLNIQPPFLARFYCSADTEWKKFIVDEFIKRLDNKEVKKHFSFLGLIKTIINKIPFNRMFDWSYDEQWNVINGIMKPAWIFSILYAVGAVSKVNFSKMDRIDKNKETFISGLTKNKDEFKEIKWSEFINKNKKDLI